MTDSDEDDVGESLVASLTQYNGEDGDQWETVEAGSAGRGVDGDDVYVHPSAEIPPPFNVPAEVSTLTGERYQLRVNVLIDSGQNVREGVVFSRRFCEQLGLLEHVSPNSAVPLMCANPAAKIAILGRLQRGVVGIRFGNGPRYMIEPLIADTLSHSVNVGLSFLQCVDASLMIKQRILRFPSFQLQMPGVLAAKSGVNGGA